MSLGVCFAAVSGATSALEARSTSNSNFFIGRVGVSAMDVGSKSTSAGSATVAGSTIATGFAATAAAFVLARASASAASPFIGSTASSLPSHSTACSMRLLRSATSARILSARTFSGSSVITLRNTCSAPGSSFLSSMQRPYTMYALM